jgi:predicted molibdopterin-dependent oxidoreductase YjgC
VRALAEEAAHVIVVTMFQGLAAGWADLILPATDALERDGTAMNVEGRLQRLRRTVLPPCPDELAWLSQLGARLGVAIPPDAPAVYAEVAEKLFRDLALEELGLQAELAAPHPYTPPPVGTTEPPPPPTPAAGEHFVGKLRLHRYHALFSGPAVERVPELSFQRPDREVELSAADAERRGISSGDAVLVRSNGTSVELRARIDRRLLEGVARVADEHAGDLHATVEVVRAT